MHVDLDYQETREITLGENYFHFFPFVLFAMFPKVTRNHKTYTEMIGNWVMKLERFMLIQRIYWSQRRIGYKV